MNNRYDDILKAGLECLSNIPYENVAHDDIYGEYAIVRLMAGKDIELANEVIKRAAMFMDIPHPWGRDVHGENDFAALNMIAAMNLIKDRITPENQALIKTLLLERDFKSMYGSENHTFVFHAVRLLVAEYYREKFIQYDLSWQEAFRRDKAFLLEFMCFRAKYGFGEFTSSYTVADLSFASFLVNFAQDAEIKHMAQMFIDILTLEAFNNTNGYYLCGACGRTYPHECLNIGHTVIGNCKRVLVGLEMPQNPAFVISPYIPDDFVIEAIETRTFPTEIRERKHLHSMYAWWAYDIPDRDQIQRLFDAGSINKYTYICPEYGIGAVNHQDTYPVDSTGDSDYAHHQQVEWTLVLPEDDTNRATKIFSSHPGSTGEHNEWTGDLRCCCTRSFATKDTALTIYNIRKPDEKQYTHLFLQTDKFDSVIFEKPYMFLKKGERYIGIFVANDFEKTGDNEIRSQGAKNAYALHIELARDNESFEKFCDKMRNTPVKFSSAEMSFTFGDITIDEKHEYISGEAVEYPYKNVYDMPWCRSIWGDGKVEVYGDGKKTVLDFNKNEIISD